MKRSELNRKIKQLNQKHIKDMQEIDNKSRARANKKHDELFGKQLENEQLRYKAEEKKLDEQYEKRKRDYEAIPEEIKKELRELISQWENYEKYFPSQKHIWINNFPQWFREATEEYKSR